MKKNNKGFMLAEVVVTATLLLAIMISLYFTYNKIYTRYNNLTNYKNLDGIYALENAIEYMYKAEGNDNINNVLILGDNKYKYLIENQTCKIIDDYCQRLQRTYNINNLIIVKQTTDAVESLNPSNNTFKDYIEYIKKYYSFDNYTKNSYLFIIEYNPQNNNETYDYSSLELR